MSDSGPTVRRLADWGQARLRALAADYETPLYVLDVARVRENAARLQSAFDQEDISYAVKANTTTPVLATLSETGLGAEAASAGEVVRALDAGFAGSDVRYTAVNPPARDLDLVCDLATDHDLIVTVGATDTLDRLRERGYDGRLCIRANPGVGAGHHEKVTTGDAPKFGVPLERVADLAADVAADPDLDLVGLHAHAGSGISPGEMDAHRELVARMGTLTSRVTDRGIDLEFCNVGGGLGVPCRPAEAPLDLDAVARATREAFREGITDGGAGDAPDVRLGIEPGRYLVADTGVLLATVNTVKETADVTVIGVDAGMTTLVRPAMYDAYHELRVLAPTADRDRVRATVAGPICETAGVRGTRRTSPVGRASSCPHRRR